jgi:outer membrane protein OmpA-like peptidoglycan-associated protein
MTRTLEAWSKLVVRIAAPIVVAAGLSACSSMPDWVDPTTWIGSDSQTSSDSSSAPEQTADAQQAPDIASIPDKPAAPSTADEQKKVADSLEADRTRAHYSSDALRGGTEQAAPPPPPAQAVAPATTAGVPAEVTAEKTPDPAVTNGVPAPENAEPIPDTPPGPDPTASPPTTTINPPPASADAAPPPAPAPAQVAVAEPPPPSTVPPPAPAAEPTTTIEAPAAPAAGGDLGFEASKAPALDPAVAKFVPQTVLQRYEQTTQSSVPMSDSSSSDVSTPPAKPRVHHKKHISTPPAVLPDAASPPVDNTPAPSNGLQPASYTPTPSVYADPTGQPPAAVVFFPHDTTLLGANARAEVKTAALAFRARGSRGYVRVVGHSSSRTPDMPLAQHLEYNFERSQARATAVARELIRDGVPADKVLVEAVGDTQPVFFETMPKGEEGNRRTEIFLQG